MRTANPSKCSECKTEQDTDIATELHSSKRTWMQIQYIIIPNMSISTRANIRMSNLRPCFSNNLVDPIDEVDVILGRTLTFVFQC